MGVGFETVVVAVIVGAAALWAVLSVRRSLRRKGGCSTCGDTANCPLADDPQALGELPGPCGLEIQKSLRDE